MTESIHVELKDIVQRYPSGDSEITVLNGISLVLEGQGINILLGPSGCGKSTLMRLMGGVRPPDVQSPTSGSVHINGEACTGVHDDVVTVFQQYANRPDLSVEENVRFPFRTKLWKSRIDKAEQDARTQEIITAVGLWEKRHLLPSQLSGGQNQRVALARALVLRPQIVLMDEPFGALDAQTREEMQLLLLNIVKTHPCMVVFITHDVDEAVYLGDRVLVLSNAPATVAQDFVIDEAQPRERLWLQSTEGSQLASRIRQQLGH